MCRRQKEAGDRERGRTEREKRKGEKKVTTAFRVIGRKPDVLRLIYFSEECMKRLERV